MAQEAAEADGEHGRLSPITEEEGASDPMAGGLRLCAFSSFSPEPSPEPRLRAGCPGTSFASVAAAELARQHLEWAQESEQVDQRQADLMMTQWKLIRSQTGMLAQQLIDVRKVQLLVTELSKDWHVQLLAWNLRHRGEGPAEDLEALLAGKGISKTEALTHAAGDPRALLPGVPVVTSQIAPPTGHEEGLGWLEILRAVDLFSAAARACSSVESCPFQEPDVILHLHDAWWLGPPPAKVRDAVRGAKLPPIVSWLPILFDPLLSDDPARPDRSGAGLELFSGVVSMSLWGRGVYERALAGVAAVLKGAASETAVSAIRWLPPLLGHVPHALHPAFAEGPLAFESVARSDLRKQLRLPETAFVVLLVGRNPPPPSSEANRKSHRTAIRAFARFRQEVGQLCAGTSAGGCLGAPVAHLHVHSDLHGAVDIESLLKDVGLSLENGASASREQLSPELLRNLYSSSDVLLQLSRAEGFGLPVIEAQACGIPVIVNGATAMAENVVLGKVLLPTARQSPSGGRNDRPGSWTPPDGAAAVEALLEIWRAPPTAIERNRARMALQSFFAPSHVAKQMVQVLQPLVPKREAAENRELQQAEVLQRGSLRQVFCGLEFQEAEQCWAKTRPVQCQDFEASLRSCFGRDWDQPTLAPRLEGQGIHRLIPTRFGQMLYNVYDVSVGRTLEVCGEWLGGERSIYQQLQLGLAPVRVLEAGANIGASTIPLALHLPPEGRVLALEASQMNLRLLNANIALAQLSNEPTERVFYDSRRLASGKPDETDGEPRRMKTVQVVTVDQLLRVDFIRFSSAPFWSIPAALLGAASSLQRFRPWLLLELSDGDEKDIRSALGNSHYECNSYLVDGKNQGERNMSEAASFRMNREATAPELDQMKKEQQKSSHHFENQHLQSREMQHRLGTMLQQSVEETHMGMARIRSEVQRRASQESEFQQRVQSLESWTTTSFPKLESEVSELRSAVDVSMKQMTQLKDQLMQQVDEWKSGHAMVMEHSTKLHDRMRKGLRALMAAHETHRSEVEQSQKILRENLEQKLENQWQEVLRQFDDRCSYKEDGDLRNRIEDLEASIDPTLERHTQGLQLKCEELEQRCKELESSSKWMGATLSQEVNSRNAMVEVFEQMLKTETSKLSSLVSDQIAVAHLDCKETQKTILDHLSKETAERQEQARGINGDLASLGNSLGDRLGRLEGAWHGVRQDWRESQSSFRSMQGQLRLLEDGLESGLQGLRSEMHSSLREERLKREVNGTSMAEQMQAWEEFHKHLRQFYMAHTALPPGDRLRDSEMDMARLAEMLRYSHDSEGARMGDIGDIPEILRDSAGEV
eukprot:s140_g39.t3